MNVLNGIPEEKLTLDQEAALINRGDFQTVILHNLRESVPYAITCAKGSLKEDEALSLCYEALSKAVVLFKPGDTRFFAYAKSAIRGEISRNWKDKDVVWASSLHETKNVPESETKLNEEGEPIEADYEDFNFKQIDLREKWQAVEPIMAQLTERERIILNMVHQSGFTFEEIGKLVHPVVTREAVRIAHLRALKKIRSILLAQGKLFKM